MESQHELPFESRSNIPLDPRTKIYLLLTVTTFMTAGSGAIVSNYIRPILALFPFLMLLFSHRWKATITFGLTYVVLYILDLVLLPVLKGVWGFLLGGMVGIYTYILPGFVMGFYLIDTTSVSEFVAAMERVHAPQGLVIPVSVVFRFFPTVKEEYAAIRDAMKMRGISTFRSPMQMLEYRIVPLMISVAKIGEDLSAASLTRGLGAPIKRTNICKIGFGAVDVVFFLASLPCWAAFVMGLLA